MTRYSGGSLSQPPATPLNLANPVGSSSLSLLRIQRESIF